MGEEGKIGVREKKGQSQEENGVALHLLMGPPTINYNCFSVLIVPVLNYTQHAGSNFLTHFCIIHVCNMVYI